MLDRSGEALAVALSAQDATGESVTDDDGQLLFWICDEDQGVELTHEIGDPEVAARALHQLADKLHQHAEQIRYRARQRTAGWT